MQKDNSKVSYRLIQLLVAVVGVVLLTLIDHTYRVNVAQEGDRKLINAVSDMQHDLSVTLNNLTFVAADLRTFLLTQSDPPDNKAFTDFAANLRDHYPALDALIYVGSDKIVHEIYPRAGNEQAIGLDLSKRPSAPYLEKAIRERQLIVDPPRTMSNGRLGVVVRSPIFRGDKFAGIAQAVLHVPEIIHNEFDDLGDEFDIQLRDENGKIFWGAGQLHGATQSRGVVVGTGAWILTIAFARPPEVKKAVLAIIWGIGGLILIAILAGIQRDYQRRLALKADIADATCELQRRNEALELEMRQRQEAESQVRRSEQSLREAQRIAHLGNWERDLVNDKLYWSDELYRIFGFDPQAFEPTLEAFLLRVHPEDQDLFLKALADAFKLREPFAPEYRIILPQGGTRYVRASGLYEYDADGNPLRTVGTVQDITAQKLSLMALEESESKYRGVLENASDGIIITSLEGKILDANRRLQSLLGYSREELLNLRVEKIHPPEDADKLRIAFTSIREHGFSLFEHLLLRKNGTTIPVEVAGTFVSFGSQQVALGIFRDIRERKRIEAELLQYRHHLEHLVEQRTAELMTINRELETFSYSVSHDLRAPLRAIKGFISAVNEDCSEQLDASCLDYLKRAQSASENMGCLIDDLLRLSKTVRSEMHLKRISLSIVVMDILHELYVAAPERQVRCIVKEGIFAHADPTLVRSLLQNLLSNAWKFTRTCDEAVIEFGIADETSQPVYFVRDNGIGFDMIHAEDLFNPFYRLHTPAAYEGSGIGLATVKRIVHRHGGRVWVESEPGRGTTFYFTLGTDQVGTRSDAKTVSINE